MNHDVRVLYVTGVFGPFTSMIEMILQESPKAKGKNKPAPSDPLEPAVALAEFRKSFDGRKWAKLDEPNAVAWLTPDEVAKISEKLRPVINELVNIVPALDKVDSPVASLPSGAAPDDCEAFDALLTRLEKYTLHVRLHYWAQYRSSLDLAARAEAAKAAQPAPMTMQLVDEVQSFCARARRDSKENDEVFGALVEEFIRTKVAEAVYPLEVSSGGIAGLEKMSQLDCIVWERSAAPPVIECGAVAIVSPVAARAVIEVKSCCDTTLTAFSHRIMRLHAEGSVLQEVYGKESYTQALGIVVWTEYEPQRFSIIAGNTVLPLYFKADGELTPNLVAFEALSDFLWLWARSA